MEIGSPVTAASRPGAVSYLFVYQTGVFALGFWGWLGVLAWQAGPLTGWHLVAAAGAISSTVVAVLLGVRIALARGAADRQEQLMRTLVEISWYTFALGPAPSPDGDADVIPFAKEARPRPRR